MVNTITSNSIYVADGFQDDSIVAFLLLLFYCFISPFIFSLILTLLSHFVPYDPFDLGCRIENCDSCFSRDFCTKCKSGFYSHRGRCFRGCPAGFAPLEELMECVGESSRTAVLLRWPCSNMALRYDDA